MRKANGNDLSGSACKSYFCNRCLNQYHALLLINTIRTSLVHILLVFLINDIGHISNDEFRHLCYDLGHFLSEEELKLATLVCISMIKTIFLKLTLISDD